MLRCFLDYPEDLAARGSDPQTAELLLDREPVIAWRLSPEGHIYPVELDHSLSSDPWQHDKYSRTALLYPSGKVVLPGDRTWDTVEEWLAYVRAEWIAAMNDKATAA